MAQLVAQCLHTVTFKKGSGSPGFEYVIAELSDRCFSEIESDDSTKPPPQGFVKKIVNLKTTQTDII